MLFRRPVRQTLDPLSRAVGSDIYVRSEAELRNALGQIAARGKPGRVLVAEEFYVGSTVDLTIAHAGTIFSCSGGSRIVSDTSGALFRYTNSSGATERPRISFTDFRAEGTGTTEATSYGAFTFFNVATGSSDVDGFTFSNCTVRCGPFFVAGNALSVNVQFLNVSDCLIYSRANADSGYVFDAYCYDSTIADTVVYSFDESGEQVRIGGPRNSIVGGTIWGGDIAWSADGSAIVGVNELSTITVSSSGNRVVGCYVGTVTINNSATDCSVTGNTITTAVTTTASNGGNTVTGNAGGATITLHASDVQAGNV